MFQHQLPSDLTRLTFNLPLHSANVLIIIDITNYTLHYVLVRYGSFHTHSSVCSPLTMYIVRSVQYSGLT